MSERREYNEILSVTNAVCFVDPYNEDFYLYMFEALYRLNMNKVIIDTYFRVSKIFTDELGVVLRAEIKEIYAKASKKVNKVEHDIFIIKQDLSESVNNRSAVKGAYYCSYEVFKQLYQIAVRYSDREKRSIALILLTIEDMKGNIPESPVLGNAMYELREALKASLRKGDTFARYSKAQFVLLLSTASIEKSEIAVKRVEKNFNEYLKQNKLKITTKTSLHDSDT